MAAAAVARFHTKGKFRSIRSRREEDQQEATFQLPPISKREKDVELSTLLNGTWQARRVIYSSLEIFFLLLQEENVRDYIPMQDIEAVEVMDVVEDISLPTSHIDVQSRRTNSKGLRKERAMSSLQSSRFQIRTAAEGFNSGRTYYFKAQSADLCNSIVEDLKKYSNEIQKRLHETSKFRESQKAVARIYNSFPFQALSCILIVLNFAVCITTAEMGLDHMSNTTSTAKKENLVKAFDQLDIAFVVIFAVELSVNAYAHWFDKFVRNAWSVFDFFIVVLSLFGLAPIGIPISTLLLLRCCRVLRLFGKLKAVSKIFSALSLSILPMANVFFVIFVIACIYAIAGVSYFYENDQHNFQSFGTAFMAMFCITVGSIDWWFENFPVVHDDGSFNWFPTLFLTSYIVTVVWVFFQVSIAVLLDNFLAASNELQQEETIELLERSKQFKQFRNPLDPLLLRLSKDYCNEADLANRINEIFLVLDSDDSGDLSSQEFQAAIKKLNFTPRIFLSDSDFISITQNKSLCNERGHLGAKEFEKVIMEQLRLFTLSRLSTTSNCWTATDEEFATIGSLKFIIMEQQRQRREIEELTARLASNAKHEHSDVRESGEEDTGARNVSSECQACSGSNISKRELEVLFENFRTEMQNSSRTLLESISKKFPSNMCHQLESTHDESTSGMQRASAFECYDSCDCLKDRNSRTLQTGAFKANIHNVEKCGSSFFPSKSLLLSSITPEAHSFRRSCLDQYHSQKEELTSKSKDIEENILDSVWVTAELCHVSEHCDFIRADNSTAKIQML